jgi:hypothetical protein
MIDYAGLNIDNPLDPDKEIIVILFKYPQRWNIHVVQILEINFNVYYGYFMDYYQRLGTLGLCDLLQAMRRDLKCRALLMDPEWGDLINVAVVELFDRILPVGLMFFDDSTMHDYNRVLASKASFVLVHCPVGLFKYGELDIPAAQFFPISQKLYIPKIATPEYDVLWFGYAAKADRPEFVSKLEALTDIKVKIYTGQNKENAASGDLSWQELADLIASAKIIVNLSRSDFPLRCHSYTSLPRAEVFQFSGRIIEAGYCGRLCISQYAPHHAFGGLLTYLPEFRTPDEMADLIRAILRSERLEELTAQFCSYINSQYNNQIFADNAKALIEMTSHSHWRYVTRVNQNYYNLAATAIQGFPYADEMRRETEMELLNKTSTRVSLNFVAPGENPPQDSRRKIFVQRD